MKLPSLKSFSAIVFFLLILVTQILTSAERDMTLEQHVQLQQDLSTLIANYVKEHLPSMTDFKMLSVYTKSPHKGNVEAYFNYSFKTPTKDASQVAETELSGVATLKRIKEEPNPEWALDKIDIDGESVTFNEPLVVAPSKDPKSSGESSKQ